MRVNGLDTSSELRVYRFCNGIKLIKPYKEVNAHRNGQYTNHTISTLLKFPCSVYFDNSSGVIQQLNERNIELCGFDSIHHAIGKSYFDRFTTQTSHSLLKNDHSIMKHEKVQIFEEAILQKDSSTFSQALSVKMPWYNNRNKVIGLFGISIILGKDSLADSLALIAKMGMLIPTENLSAHIGFETKGIYLSKQQRCCAELLLEGLSTKEIAERMKLSPRTIESYIDYIKSKLNCRNKSELIVTLCKIMK